MSDQGNGQGPQQPDPQDGQGPGRPPGQQPPDDTTGHRLPGGNTGGQSQTGGQPQGPQGQGQGQGQPQTGGQPTGPQGPPSGGQPTQGQGPYTGGQPTGPQGPGTGGQQQPWSGGQQQQPWSGGQQPWSGNQPPWDSGGQGAQPPSWSTGQTGPNVGPTMNNPQSSYYDRFSEASGEGVRIPADGGGGGSRGKVLIGLAAALVLIVAAVGIFAFTRGDDSPKEAGGSKSTSKLPPVKATTWTNPTLAVGARALKSGWQAQQANDDRGVFDVPKTKDWKLDSSDTLRGYANPSGKERIVARAPAEFGVGYCSADKDSNSAWLGLVNVGKRDPSDAGPDVAQRFADIIAEKKDGSKAKQGKMSDPKSIKVNQGTIPALQYTITTAVGEPDDCDKGKDLEIRTVTFSSGGRTYQLVSVRVVDGKKELPAKTLDEIFSTFRPSN
ncbi:hypothetical protein [Flexivirga sp. B27]